VRHELQQGSTGEQLDERFRLGHGHGLELSAEPFEGLAVVVGDPGDQGGGRFWPVVLRPAAIHPRRALGDQSLQGAVGIRARQTGGASDGVAGTRSPGEQDLVDQAFGGGEAETGEIRHDVVWGTTTYSVKLA
jgi:hypothetical protein